MSNLPGGTQPSYVQVVPDGTGKIIRNVSVVELDPTTQTFVVKQMQIVGIVDPSTGVFVDPLTAFDLQETNRLLRAVVRGIELLCDAHDRPEDLLPAATAPDAEERGEDA